MKILIRSASTEDYIPLAEIGHETFYETWRPVNTEDDMQMYLKKSFDLGKIKSEIEDKDVNTFFLAFADDKLVGYCKMRCDRYYEEFGKESPIEIERIYVRKEFQRKKIGKALMDKCIDYSVEKKYDWLWLGVNVDNLIAIDFYKRYDFIVFGEKNFQLGQAVDTDYLMKKKLK
jgi:ribosomal protein S18 acetylase RimI-like enzyme